MQQKGLHDRHRNRDGEISRKHGNALVSTLRKIYGATFAEGFDPHTKLSDVLHALDEHSLTQLVHDHEHGRLEAKINQQQPGAA